MSYCNVMQKTAGDVVGLKRGSEHFLVSPTLLAVRRVNRGSRRTLKAKDGKEVDGERT